MSKRVRPAWAKKVIETPISTEKPSTMAYIYNPSSEGSIGRRIIV
jgi:hypothetical protein